MSFTKPPPAASPENQIHSGGFSIPANLPKNSVEIPITPNGHLVFGHGKDTYKGIPGDGVTPG